MFSNLIAIRVFALVAKSSHKTLIVAFKESFLVNLLEYNVTRGNIYIQTNMEALKCAQNSDFLCLKKLKTKNGFG